MSTRFFQDNLNQYIDYNEYTEIQIDLSVKTEARGSVLIIH